MSAMRTGRCACALAAATAALAGCGGGAGRTPANPQLAPSPPSITAAISPNAVTLPRSANGPTTCTVYEPGQATQVIFESEQLDVSAECRVWIRGQTGEGYLWGYQPISAIAATAVPVCRLTDAGRNVTADVVQDTGFRPITAAEQATGASACGSLVGVGWRERVRRAHRRARSRSR